jgi:hypothetical protein
MTAKPDAPHLGIVVEGPGDLAALPVLLRIHLAARGEYRDLLGKPIPTRGRDRAIAGKGLEGYVQAAANRPGCRAVLVLLDSDKDPACQLGPELLTRAQSVARIPVVIALAEPNFEGWIVASAESLGIDGLDFAPTTAPARLLEAALPGKYVKPVYQPKLAARIDLNLATSRSQSLRRTLDRVDRLIAECLT